MPGSLEVQPDHLATAGQAYGTMAENLQSTRAALAALAGVIPQATGDGGAASAFEDLWMNWSNTLAQLAQAVDGISKNLASASSTYLATDDQIIPE